MNKIRDEMSCPDYLNKGERIVLDWTGPLLISMGILGALFTLIFDRVAGRIIFTFGWVQMLGLVVSLGLTIFGIVCEKFLHEIKQILDDYVRK